MKGAGWGGDGVGVERLNPSLESFFHFFWGGGGVLPGHISIKPSIKFQFVHKIFPFPTQGPFDAISEKASERTIFRAFLAIAAAMGAAPPRSLWRGVNYLCIFAVSLYCTAASLLGAPGVLSQFPPLPPDPASPSCMINMRGCPIPEGWDTDWSLINSTALMSADPGGFNTTKRWGLVTLDWQSGWPSWIRPNPADINVEAFSANACRELKAKGSVRYCSIYHNMELALEWLESERAVMDKAHVDAGWFLRFQNGSVFNTARQVRPGQGPMMKQYFINWSNPDASAYFVGAITNATSVEGVDSTFTDDSPGVPAEHPELQPTLNVSNASLLLLQRATQNGEQHLAEALAAKGRTCWNCIDGVEGPTGGQWGMNTRRPPSDVQGCSKAMRSLCARQHEPRGMFMEYDTGWREPAGTNLYHNQTIAAFLVTRPALAFIGTSYYLNDANWNPLFAMDVGEPLEGCVEAHAAGNTPTGVFSRKWTKGTVALDCNTYTASMPFESLPLYV